MAAVLLLSPSVSVSQVNHISLERSQTYNNNKPTLLNE